MTIALFTQEGAIFIAFLLFTLIIFAPFFEWMLHKHIMHKEFKFLLWKLSYAYNAHAKVHHKVFREDNSYHVKDEKDKRLIPMAWWNGGFLVSVGVLPFIFLCHFVGHRFAIISAVTLGCSAYYGAYEFLHWCMHNPGLRRRLIARYKFFRLLNGHHILHHRYPNKNYNVVFPICDRALGTFIRRAPKAFRQVRGRAVPSVQPLRS